MLGLLLPSSISYAQKIDRSHKTTYDGDACDPSRQGFARDDYLKKKKTNVYVFSSHFPYLPSSITNFYCNNTKNKNNKLVMKLSNFLFGWLCAHPAIMRTLAIKVGSKKK